MWRFVGRLFLVNFGVAVDSRFGLGFVRDVGGRRRGRLFLGFCFECRSDCGFRSYLLVVLFFRVG